MSYEFTAPIKDPDSILWHAFDWKGKGWLDAGETITSKTVTSSVPAELQVDQVTEANGVVSYQVRGGIEGQSYTVTCRITTSANRTDDRSILYTIGQR